MPRGNKRLGILMVCAICLLRAGSGMALDITGPEIGDQYGEEGTNATHPNGVTGGIVNINGGTVTGGAVIGGYGTDTDAYGNIVTFNSGSVEFNVGGGRAINGDAYQNKLILNGGSTQLGVFGGNSQTSGDANANEVIVNGGDWWGIEGGASQFGNADGNRMTMHGGTADVIFGGSANRTTGHATGNVVTMYGGSVNGIIAGDGYDASNNTVNLYKGAIVTGYIRGGSVNLSGASTNNTLNLFGWAGTGLFNVNDFQNYNFYFSGNVADGDVILGVTHSGANATTMDGSVITIGFMGGGSALRLGDTITLVSNTAGLSAAGIDTSAIDGQTFKPGLATIYTFTVNSDANRLWVEVASAVGDPDAKSLSMGRVSTLSALRQGGDLIADNGIQNLLGVFDWQDSLASRSSSRAYASLASAGWSGPTFFAAVGGGHYSLKAGHRTSIDGVSALAGMGWRNQGACGSLLLGAFFETGYADYDSNNVYGVGRASVKGDGDSRYFGGGLLARYDWQSGLYAEASARIGAVKNKFDGSLVGGGGNRATYDITSAYYGAHAGLGYKFRPAANSLLDLSLKYLWTRQDSDTATIDGDRVKFKADDSHRLRAGARYSYNVNSCFSPYAGAAFEYEFDGKSRAFLGTHALSAPSVKGGTGIGEIGFTYRKNAFSADLGIQGHVGKREAVTGTLRVGWSF